MVVTDGLQTLFRAESSFTSFRPESSSQLLGLPFFHAGDKVGTPSFYVGSGRLAASNITHVHGSSAKVPASALHRCHGQPVLRCWRRNPHSDANLPACYLVEDEVLTGRRPRESLDTQFGSYNAFYRTEPENAAIRIGFENVERMKHS